MEKPYKCMHCGMELTSDEFVGGGHAVPDVDPETGEVCGEELCGPVQIDTTWATARISEMEAQLAAERAHVKELQSIVRQLKHGLD